MNCSDLSLMKSSQINRSLFKEYMTIFAVFKVLTKIIKSYVMLKESCSP